MLTPHSRQNFEPLGICLPQFEQYIMASFRLYCFSNERAVSIKNYEKKHSVIFGPFSFYHMGLLTAMLSALFFIVFPVIAATATRNSKSSVRQVRVFRSILENALSIPHALRNPPKVFLSNSEKLWKTLGGFAIMVLRVRAIRESPLQNSETRGVELAISRG